MNPPFDNSPSPLGEVTLYFVAMRHYRTGSHTRTDLKLLEEAGFKSERFTWSVNFCGNSKVSIQLSTEEFYQEFPSRSIAADVHGILMRVASLEDTLEGKIRAWKDTSRRQSKKLKNLGDIARLVESHPGLWQILPEELKRQIDNPGV